MFINKLKLWLYKNLEVNKSKKLSVANKIICFFILWSFFNSIIETENSLYLRYQFYFNIMEKIFFAIFFTEYIIRLWISDLNIDYKEYKYKRIKYFFSFYAILDLVTILIIAMPYFSDSNTVLRIFRLIKILRVIKLGRFSSAIARLKYALASRAPDLLLTISVALIIMVFAACLLYFIEGKANPQAFGSVPRAMWWAVATLTTVGYGDVYPITALGRIAGAIIAIVGLGLIAMPAGILASAFSDAMKEERIKDSKKQY